jgi:GT2 family glycosyltransferase
MSISIDIVIPSFRLTTKTILPILNLKQPEGSDVRFFLVADNPGIAPDPAITAMIDNKRMFLIINSNNEGASLTRNNGIEAGNADWILFLDDDVEIVGDLLFTYTDAILKNPDATGFIGLILLPDEINSFTAAVNISGLMDVFYIARKHTSFAWGATANMMLRRAAMQNERFSNAYPKSGGGEDVEFFIRIRQNNNFKNYLCLPQAQVTHPWWNNGKTDFKRFFRYGKGNSHLAERNPAYSSYDFLNTSETLFIALIVFIIVMLIDPKHSYLIAAFIGLSLILEFIISILWVMRQRKVFNLKYAIYVMLLKNSISLGALAEHLSRFYIKGIGQRFHYNGQIKKAHFVLNTNKIIKLVLYIAAIVYAVIKVL